MNIVEEIENNLKDYHFIALLIIIGAATFLRFQYAFFEGMWVDEGRYAYTAFELASHPFNYFTPHHGQITKFPPVYPYLLTLATYIFGKTEMALRMVSPLIGVVAVGITYLIGKEIRNRNVGLLAAALLAVNPLHWYMSERLLIGATLAAVYSATLLALYYGMEDRKYSKYSLWSVGPLTALSLMTKQPAYTLGLIITIYFIYKKRKEILEVVQEDIEFRKSQLYETLTDRNYYITVGLGILTLSPWMIRNTGACGVPLCGLARAADFASKGSVDPTLSSVQGNLYFLTQIGAPTFLTWTVAAAVGLRIVYYIFNMSFDDPDKILRIGMAIALVSGGAYFLKTELFAMAVITSMALLPKNDGEKLLWIWAGIGIGFMSIPTVKVPRYIVFVMPALLTLAALTVWDISNWISKVVDNSTLKPIHVAIVLLAPLLFTSYMFGSASAARGAPGTSDVAKAGKWIGSNTPEDVRVAGTSPTVLRFYVYPRHSTKYPKNKSDFKSFLKEEEIDYLQVGTYERTQRQWVQTDLPPFRIPNQMRAGGLNQRERAYLNSKLQNMTIPTYLTPVGRFGQDNSIGRPQPGTIVYRVNRTVLQ